MVRLYIYVEYDIYVDIVFKFKIYQDFFQLVILG